MSSNETSRGLRCIFKQSLSFLALAAGLGGFTGTLLAEDVKDVKPPPSGQTATPDPKSEEARKILEKAYEKMAGYKTFKADILDADETNKTKSKTVFYQRFNPDGSMDNRMEIKDEDDKEASIYITNNQGKWELYEHMALKWNFQDNITKSAQKQIQMISSHEEAASLQNQYKLSEVTLNGKNCFVVKEIISSKWIEKLKQISGNKGSPGGKVYPIMLKVYYIGKDDYFIYGQEDFNTKGDKTNSTIYTNVELGIPLADELFRIPNNYKIMVIETLKQYTDFLIEKNTK